MSSTCTYHNVEFTAKFLSEGITYEELSHKDLERHEADSSDEYGEMPDDIPLRPSIQLSMIYVDKLLLMALKPG
jgi:hypothetical protein